MRAGRNGPGASSHTHHLHMKQRKYESTKQRAKLRKCANAKQRQYETTKVRNNESAKQRKCETTKVRSSESAKL